MTSGVEPAPESSEDDLADAVDAFEAALERGERVSPSAWAARYGALAPDLLPLLDGLMLLQRAATDIGPAGPAALPERIGGYRIVRELGRGGMGVVFLAEQTSLGRRVALKVLPAQFVGDAAHVERFRRESLAAAQLAHPNIVAVYDVAVEGDQPYYAMQYVEGYSLQDVLRTLGAPSSHGRRSASSGARAIVRALQQRHGEPREASDDAEATPGLGHAEAARLALEVCRALAHAHAGGVIHRDVKPGNVLVDMEGRALVADFGLCQVVDEGDLTRSGELVGTLRYMAPEQIDGEATTRSDVYGVGMLLYELLTLRPAFTGTRRSSLVRDVLHTEPVRPRRIDPRIPADLETITLKATAKLESQRYGSAADMANDLEAFLGGRAIAARRPSAAYALRLFCRRNRGAVLLALALVAGLVALGVLYIRDLRAARADLTESAYVAHLNAAEAALLGGSVARARVDLGEAPAALRSWEWSHLAARANQSLVAIDPFPGEHLVRSLEYDPTGRRLLVSGHDGVAILDAEDGRVLSALAGRDPRIAAWTADGEGVVLGKDRAGLVLVRADALERQLAALSGVERPERLLVLADGRVVYGTLQGGVGVWDPDSGAHASTVAFGARVLWLGHLAPPGPSASDAASSDPWSGLWAMGADGLLRRFGAEPLTVTLSEASTELIAADLDLASGTGALGFSTGSIHIVELAGGRLLKALAPGAASHALCYDPSAAKLYSGGDDDQLRSWDLDNDRTAESLVGHVDDIFHVAQRRDRSQLATGDERGNVLVWSPRFKGGLQVLCGHVDDVAMVALDASGRLALSSGLDGLAVLWELDSGTLRWTQPWVGGVIDAARFTSDGRRVYASGSAGDVVALDVETGAVVARCPVRDAGALALALDGERVLVARGQRVEAWSLDLQRRLGSWPIGDARIRRLEVIEDRRWLLLGCSDGALLRLDLDTGDVLGRTQLAERQVHDLAVDPTTGLAAATVYDARVLLVDPARDAVVSVLDTAGGDGVGELLFSVGFGVNGSRIFATTRSGRLLVWDARTLGRLVDLSAHKEYALALAIGPMGGQVVTGSSDGTLRVFDTLTSREKLDRSRELAAGPPSAPPTWTAYVDRLAGRAQRGLFSFELPRARGAFQLATAIALRRPGEPRSALLEGMVALRTDDRVAADRALAVVRDALEDGAQLGPDAHACLAIFHWRRAEYSAAVASVACSLCLGAVEFALGVRL